MPQWVILFMIAALYTVFMFGKSFITGAAYEPARIVITAVAGLVAAGAAFWLTR